MRKNFLLLAQKNNQKMYQIKNKYYFKYINSTCLWLISDTVEILKKLNFSHPIIKSHESKNHLLQLTTL